MSEEPPEASSEAAPQRLREWLRDLKPETSRETFGAQRPDRDPERQHFDRVGQEQPSRIVRHTLPPETLEEEIPQITQQAGGAFPNISFLLSNASVTENNETTYRVGVYDGKIKGEFPAGMGFGGYELDIDDPSDAIIHAGITFNPDTLAITSRFLGVTTAADFPESRIVSDTNAFLYWQIGYAYLDGDTFRVVNTLLGNIDFVFSYGEDGGFPALVPVKTDGPGWLRFPA